MLDFVTHANSAEDVLEAGRPMAARGILFGTVFGLVLWAMGIAVPVLLLLHSG